jgi:hypothetical protein
LLEIGIPGNAFKKATDVSERYTHQELATTLSSTTSPRTAREREAKTGEAGWRRRESFNVALSLCVRLVRERERKGERGKD